MYGTAPSIFDIDRKTDKKRNLVFYLFFPLSILFSETAVKLSVYGFSIDKSWIFVTLFALGAGSIITAVISFLPRRAAFITSVCVSSALLVFYGFQLVYYKFFKNFFLWQTIGLASGLTDFWKSGALATLHQWYMILILAIPLVFLSVFGRKFMNFERKRPAFGAFAAVAFVILNALGIGLTFIDSGYKTSYFDSYSVDSAMHNFGMLHNTCLELRYLMFKPSVGAFSETKNPDDNPKPPSDTQPKPIEYNKMDIDFETLIANETDSEIKAMHEYFSSRTPTAKNEYTGMFEGKNLILLTLEGFSDKCIDPVLTPTLYKMANEGFIFENFYNSLWGGSTASGEYAVTSGNFYTAATALKLAGDNSWPFALGNQFSKRGYLTKSYHNHTYTYYGRNLAHAAYGYDYKGIGNGLEGITKCWPESDLEMMDITGPEFVNSGQPFHIYYMTVSGHCEYSFNDNMMCYKNRELVKDMQASDSVRAYYACQIELDRALQSLVNQLDAAGVLENTVFAMCADHYPYALDDAALAELYGLEAEGIRNNFDLYRNGFILWSPSMEEPIRVSKPCSAIDILPTLSNLFGLEYDSRLMMGSDILSDADSPVILNSVGTIGSNHWITAQGAYNAYSKTFTPSEDCTLSEEQKEEYIKKMNSSVLAKEKYSVKIMDRDYYAKVFK